EGGGLLRRRTAGTVLGLDLEARLRRRCRGRRRCRLPAVARSRGCVARRLLRNLGPGQRGPAGVTEAGGQEDGGAAGRADHLRRRAGREGAAALAAEQVALAVLGLARRAEQPRGRRVLHDLRYRLLVVKVVAEEQAR